MQNAHQPCYSIGFNPLCTPACSLHISRSSNDHVVDANLLRVKMCEVCEIRAVMFRLDDSRWCVCVCVRVRVCVYVWLWLWLIVVLCTVPFPWASFLAARFPVEITKPLFTPFPPFDGCEHANPQRPLFQSFKRSAVDPNVLCGRLPHILLFALNTWT